MDGTQFEKTLPVIFWTSNQPFRIAQVAPLYEACFLRQSKTKAGPLCINQVTIWVRTIRNSKTRIDSTEWNITPADLYGCLCHKPECNEGTGLLTILSNSMTEISQEVTEHGSVEPI